MTAPEQDQFFAKERALGASHQGSQRQARLTACFTPFFFSQIFTGRFPMNPQELKTIMGSGLLSFPLTDFDSNGDFNPAGYAKRLEWLAPYGASALFAAGGTGEFFSLTGEEYPGIIKTAVDTCRGVVPIIAGAGGPTRFAIQCAQAAEGRRARHPAAAALPHRSRPGRPGRARRSRVQEREVRRDRLQPRHQPPEARHAGRPGRAQPQPRRLQGRRGRHRSRWLPSTRRWATASPTWAACPRPRCMPPPTRQWARRCIRRPSSTSFRRPPWISTRPLPPTTCPRSTTC